jgi:hypothetical protein
MELFGGLALLFLGGEALVRGASRLAGCSSADESSQARSRVAKTVGDEPFADQDLRARL